MGGSFIVGGARTPFGKLGGVLKEASAAQLGAAAIRGALHSASVHGAQVEQVLMGMGIQAGAGQIPSRQAAAGAGIPWCVPSDTINKVCASGMRTIGLADSIIRAGDAAIVVAGGMESMSGVPYGLRSARWGIRMGNAELIDLMLHDGLLCAFDGVPMAVHGSRAALRYGISRQEQDEWALRSHSLAISAALQGKHADEMVPYSISNSMEITADECPRNDTNLVKLAQLKPIYVEDGVGTITAGNAPGVNDGAAALLLMSQEAADNGGHDKWAEIIGYASVSMEPHQLAEAPAFAIRKVLKQTGVSLESIDLFEVNEAFAAVVLSCAKQLNWQDNKVNVNGGAIAIGHPIGASGTRIVLTLVKELQRRGGGLGIAAICSGGGQGDALLVRVG
ncbi:acetyl-CoA C-acetyltransferase [Paenibacillus xylaniclasticus]|uniref:acetyl-CoA C-acetyltransferase n=1 Tax=Paenibacillus xylaniclasticus TaxID=588083 RepID=UPI000FD8302A|nr:MULTISPECIES: acetyl-CoA C-acetyltransferase [Paenibacillus]GFN31679.1 acetyl-CoA acetyltransferase [Paenibacillus curdlanolyticus]